SGGPGGPWVSRGSRGSLRVSGDEREAVQKKTFTKWVNSHLARVTCRIGDLYADLRDGRMLLRLLEVLSGEQLVSVRGGPGVPSRGAPAWWRSTRRWRRTCCSGSSRPS
uniref:Calponin-homology (CH) domain-containing protein n=1 Tax=Apteryx owenii TaxID=8824 RepID=A0A8B9PIQ6_APTOW